MQKNVWSDGYVLHIHAPWELGLRLIIITCWTLLRIAAVDREV